MDCSYLNMWDLAWGRIVWMHGLWEEMGWFLEKFSDGMKFYHWTTTGPWQSDRIFARRMLLAAPERRNLLLYWVLAIYGVTRQHPKGRRRKTDQQACGHPDCSWMRGATCSSSSCTAEEIQDKINLLCEGWRGNRALTTRGPEIMAWSLCPSDLWDMREDSSCQLGEQSGSILSSGLPAALVAWLFQCWDIAAHHMKKNSLVSSQILCTSW